MNLSTWIAKLPENNRVERIWKIAQVDFKRRYYNDRLGLLWALLKPVFEVCVYYFVFKLLFESQVENFAFFLFSGIVFMNIFTETTIRSLNLLTEKLYLIDNIQFNRIDIFISQIISTFFGFTFNLAAMILVMLASQIKLGWEILYLIPVFICFYLISLGVSLILASFQPFLKDINHFWDMMILVLIWSSGVFFKPELIIEKFPVIGYLNPFVGLLQNLRAALLPNFEFMADMLFINLIQTIVILGIGYVVFKKYGALAVEKL